MPERPSRYRVSWYAPKIAARLMIGGRPMSKREADANAEALRRQGLRDVRVTPAGRLP